MAPWGALKKLSEEAPTIGRPRAYFRLVFIELKGTDSRQTEQMKDPICPKK
jgi:hypothetical protein